jgi:hypothetical protein
MRPRPLAVIAVSTLLIAAAVGFQLRGQILHGIGADRPTPGSAPLASGTIWTCPAGSLTAFGSGKIYYSSVYPSPPPFKTRPARCYKTEGEATLAGYKPAPPPKGGALLDGIYLVPASNLVKSNCGDLAAKLRIVIPCPTLLPAEVAGSLCTPITACTDNVAFVAAVTVLTPIEYPGDTLTSPAAIRLVVAAQPLSSPGARLPDGCASVNSGPSAMGQPTLWAKCGTSNYVFLTWQTGTEGFVVNAANDTPATRRLVQLFASKLVAVSPPRG